VGDIFNTFIVQPIFNVLTLIYALLPGHNFGLAIIIFTLVARFALYPLLKKQLRHTKAIRELQPELKKIKEKTKGDKQQETLLTMELYKEREVRPMSIMGLMVVQLVLFYALYAGLNKVVRDPTQIYEFSYEPIQNLALMQDLRANIELFDETLFGFVDLTRAAFSGSGVYVPALVLVLGSAIVQYFQIRQTMPNDKNRRKLRDILKEAGEGNQADPAEMNAVIGRNMATVMPILLFIVTINFPAALPLYWFTGGVISFLQHLYLLTQDESALAAVASAEVVTKQQLRTSS